MTLRRQNKVLWIATCILSVLVCVTIYIYICHPVPNTTKEKSYDKVCLSLQEYKTLHKKVLDIDKQPIDDSRDRKVLNDPLYPALNRTEFNTHQGILEKIESKALYNATQNFSDRYRLVGYVTNPDDNKDTGGNVWKLFGREKDRNQAEFYMIPANNNYDMKIMLNNDMIVGEKLRDMYTIPKQLLFKSPLLNQTPYEITELPMNDLTNLYH